MGTSSSRHYGYERLPELPSASLAYYRARVAVLEDDMARNPTDSIFYETDITNTLSLIKDIEFAHGF
jgi:hypothetical protein